MFSMIEAKNKGQAASGGGSGTFDAMKQQMGAIVKTPMTRTEALEILNIEDTKEPTEPIDHTEIIEVS